MENNNRIAGMDLELICMIVNSHVGTKAIKIAKRNCVSGGTIMLGKGTAKSRVLELLDLTESRKEIVLMASDSITVHHALEALNKELCFHKPNRGIAFTIPIANIIRSKKCEYCGKTERKSEEDTMYRVIFTIVDKGMAEDVVDAAKKGGARGGTIINARGSGIHETQTLFSMPIEPEKELIMIVCKTEQTESIVCSIKEDLHIDEPGKGIIFVLDANNTYG